MDGRTWHVHDLIRRTWNRLRVLDDGARQPTVKLKALADPTRISILRMIRYFDADNTQIAGWLDVSRPTVSVHAKTLAEAGFISTERDGRQARTASTQTPFESCAKT